MQFGCSEVKEAMWCDSIRSYRHEERKKSSYAVKVAQIMPHVAKGGSTIRRGGRGCCHPLEFPASTPWGLRFLPDIVIYDILCRPVAASSHHHLITCTLLYRGLLWSVHSLELKIEIIFQSYFER
jgi:hypothetical protein